MVSVNTFKFLDNKRSCRNQHLLTRWFVDQRGRVFFHVETSDDADPSETWRESVNRLVLFNFLLIIECELYRLKLINEN